jgi:Prenyltransferase and squalene oxidase repeat
MSLVSGPGLGGGGSALALSTDKLVDYVVSLDKRSDEYEYWLTEHLRLNGVYWGLTSLHLLRHPQALPRDGIIQFTMSCWDSGSGGFGAAPGHDAHMLYTCSAVQLLAMADGLTVLDEPVSDDSSQTKRQKLGACKLTFTLCSSDSCSHCLASRSSDRCFPWGSLWRARHSLSV